MSHSVVSCLRRWGTLYGVHTLTSYGAYAIRYRGACCGSSIMERGGGGGGGGGGKERELHN